MKVHCQFVQGCLILSTLVYDGDKLIRYAIPFFSLFPWPVGSISTHIHPNDVNIQYKHYETLTLESR